MRWRQFTLQSIFIATGACATCLAAWKVAGVFPALVVLYVMGAGSLVPPHNRRLHVVGRVVMAVTFVLLICSVLSWTS